MRDIRPDLHERILSMEDEIKDLRRMLERENQRMGNTYAPFSSEFASTREEDTLAGFIMKFLTGSPASKEEIKNEAIKRGFFLGSDKSPGRAIHLVLTNMVNGGNLRKTSNDEYEIV